MMNHDCAGHHDRGGYRYTVHVPFVSHNRRFSCPLWICLRCNRPHRDAQQETTRPPSHRRHLLIALRGFRLGDAIVGVPLGPGLPSIYPRRAFFLRGISGPHGSPAPLARLGPIAPHRDGPVVHSAPNGFLCGQRTQLTDLERLTEHRLLGNARGDRDTARHLCLAATSAGGPFSQVSPSDHDLWCEYVLRSKDENRFVECRQA